MNRSACLYFSFSAAILVAPLGWFVGGFAAAQEIEPVRLAISLSTAAPRPLYVPGVYFGHAIAASVIAWLVVFTAVQGYMRRR